MYTDKLDLPYTEVVFILYLGRGCLPVYADKLDLPYTEVVIILYLGRGRLPVYADKLDLPYTEAVIMEIQRMANLVPLSLPHCNSRKGQWNIYFCITFRYNEQ